MRIGVFSKFEMVGGSERRCVAMANALARHTSHEAVLLSEGGFPATLNSEVHRDVHIARCVFSDESTACEALYALDCLLVVNTDSKWFCRADYWQGRSGRHTTCVDLSRMRQIIFLFNFIVSPSRHLWELEEHCPRLKIITANRKFLDEVGSQDRYHRVHHLPRVTLESPIDPIAVRRDKSPSSVVRIGMHSTSNGDKWNQQWPELIQAVNERCGMERVRWRFMGMPGKLRAAVAGIANVESRAENTQPVCDFLKELDVFAFFSSWKREEPWSRSAAEALMTGCPVICTSKGGNVDQIIHGNNGFLCKTLEMFATGITAIVEKPRLRNLMAQNAIARSRSYEPESVIRRFIEFVEY